MFSKYAYKNYKVIKRVMKMPIYDSKLCVQNLHSSISLYNHKVTAENRAE